MIKRGFTLAEVLITLTIIGVVAAITLPALTAKIASAKIGPALSKSYNAMTNANELLKLDEMSKFLFANSQTSKVNYIEKLVEKMDLTKMKPLDAATGYTIYNGKTELAPIASNTERYKSKDGTIYYFSKTWSEVAEMLTNKEKYAGYSINTFIDINGETKPNILGKDIFIFCIDGKGAIIPFGGLQYNEYYGMDVSAEPNWANDKSDSCKKKAVNSGHTCAGAVADNNWSANY